MAEQIDSGATIERIKDLSIVSLKVSKRFVTVAKQRLAPASRHGETESDSKYLWIGPDRCLLVSKSISADSLIKRCRDALADVLHIAVDNSAAMTMFRIVGSGTRGLLASGCGLDFRTEKFPVGMCCRTRFAQIPALIVSKSPEQFEIYVDRSYGEYLGAWLRDSSSLL